MICRESKQDLGQNPVKSVFYRVKENALTKLFFTVIIIVVALGGIFDEMVVT